VKTEKPLKKNEPCPVCGWQVWDLPDRLICGCCGKEEIKIDEDIL